MKKTLLSIFAQGAPAVCLVALTVCLVACHKNTGARSGGSVVGKWRLTETFLSPGVGGGGWQPVATTNFTYLALHKDGSLSMTPYNLYSANSYQVTSDSTLVFLQGPGTLPLQTQYQLSDTVLTMYPPCIEPCGQRYIAVQQ